MSGMDRVPVRIAPPKKDLLLGSRLKVLSISGLEIVTGEKENQAANETISLRVSLSPL
jgi:hypothetical protein